ncbi:hypothetical protein NDU88_005081 [Pleurodeles waltl]|uniref:Uncharacterized protein n=1 Tax=Pleurodeles waltl TaxID=8319 RepID=A0AAV7QHU1_PLEWA|nr:hypothetical protein NDU88_005081 [Pleurodeles waltl]
MRGRRALTRAEVQAWAVGPGGGTGVGAVATSRRGRLLGQDRREETRPWAASGPVPGAAVRVLAPVCAASRASCGPFGSALGAPEDVAPPQPRHN